jgi:phage terminase Nu1 subunit (DNA packaging protein)
VLLLAGRPQESARTLQEAIQMYRQKGNTVAAGKLETALAELSSAVD